MKIAAYKIVIKQAEDIEDKVNELIKSGWQPFGSPGVLPPMRDSEQTETIVQAMVRTEAD
jgi:hypothetical protein